MRSASGPSAASLAANPLQRVVHAALADVPRPVLHLVERDQVRETPRAVDGLADPVAEASGAARVGRGTRRRTAQPPQQLVAAQGEEVVGDDGLLVVRAVRHERADDPHELVARVQRAGERRDERLRARERLPRVGRVDEATRAGPRPTWRRPRRCRSSTRRRRGSTSLSSNFFDGQRIPQTTTRRPRIVAHAGDWLGQHRGDVIADQSCTAPRRRECRRSSRATGREGR